MPDLGSTLKNSGVAAPRQPSGGEPCAGLVLLFGSGQPAARVIAMDSQGSIELGRGANGLAPDPCMSRRHARVTFDGSRFWVVDLGSQNGTACDGKPIQPNQLTEVERVIRTGDSLFGVMRDITPLASSGVSIDGERVMGPALQALLAEVKQAATLGKVLHIAGESGTGKEQVARHFHDNRPRPNRSFVPVNCAAIPHGLAERLLFGAQRGAYSGADTNAEGYLHAADGGTLFLDEIGDLDLNIQAKLLRVLETKELLPLGATRPTSVDLAVCSATNKGLKFLVAAGRFREDLYYRLGRPVVVIPPLRKRPEEIPWLVDLAVKRAFPKALLHPSLIETCLLRPWPGNVRELLAELRGAAQTAATRGSARVESSHLPEDSGTPLRSISSFTDSDSGSGVPTPVSEKSESSAEYARMEAALRSCQGNVSAAARLLGMHRTQLRRDLDRYGIDPLRFVIDDKTALTPESK